MPVTTRSSTRGPRPTPHYVYDSDIADSPAPARKHYSYARKEEDTSDDESWSSEEQVAIENRGERMRLRPWLEKQILEGQCIGLQWIHEKNKIVKIPWKHASRHGWRLGDACLFQRWAIHSGKYRPGMKINPKKWKANFRCALNSLPDIREVKEYSQKRGRDAFKVYQLLPTKKQMMNGTHKSLPNQKSTALENGNSLLPLTITAFEETIRLGKEYKPKELKAKPLKRKRAKQDLGRENRRKYDDDQRVPDYQIYNHTELVDHEGYTVASEHGVPVTALKMKPEKPEEILKSCDGYNFNGSPTGDLRQDMYMQYQQYSPDTRGGDVGTEGLVLTDEQVVEILDELNNSNSGDSEGSGSHEDLPNCTSESSIYDWVRGDLPEPKDSCRWVTEMLPQENSHDAYPFIRGFEDDRIMPCIAQPAQTPPTDCQTNFEWQLPATSLQYQTL